LHRKICDLTTKTTTDCQDETLVGMAHSIAKSSASTLVGEVRATTVRVNGDVAIGDPEQPHMTHHIPIDEINKNVED
jgi:hypothetical protein